MLSFKLWLENRIDQIKNAIEYIDTFPELKSMNFNQRVSRLKDMGHSEGASLLLAAQIGAILKKGIVAQDVVATTPDDWHTLNKLNQL